MKWQELDISKLFSILPGENFDEKLSNAFDIKYGDYDYSNDLRIISHDEIERFFNELLSSKNKRKDNATKVLIAGANSGYEVQFFSGCEVVAVELSRRALKKLNDKYPYVQAVEGNFMKLEFQDKYFDIYCCLRSIQSYGVEVDRTIDEAIRVLKPNGTIVFSISNGYILNGEIQKGMFDPSRQIYNLDLPKQKISEIKEKLQIRGFDTKLLETQSEIIIKSEISKTHDPKRKNS